MGKKENDRTPAWRDYTKEYILYKSNKQNYRKQLCAARHDDLSPIDYFCKYLRDNYDENTALQFTQKENEDINVFRNRCRKKLDRMAESLQKEMDDEYEFQQNHRAYYELIYPKILEVMFEKEALGENIDCKVLQGIFLDCAVREGLETDSIFRHFISKARAFCIKVGLPVLKYASTAGTDLVKIERKMQNRKRKRTVNNNKVPIVMMLCAKYAAAELEI